MTYHAHSAPPGGKPQTVKEHLTEVARRAREFAEPFGAGDEAELAGLLHDIGKYTKLFQDRLAGKEHGLDHWSAGAWIAAAQFAMTAAALAIGGHHTGLQRLDEVYPDPLDLPELASERPQPRLTEADADVLLDRLHQDGLNLSPPATSVFRGPLRPVADMLDVRMLYSALVDADFLDTARHAGHERPSGPPLSPGRALQVVRDHIDQLKRTRKSSPEVRELRQLTWDRCLKAAEEDRGVWTLSAPTGAGKTLAMLGFALRHAEKHKLRRIVFVVPYLSIIDQTAREYRRLFAPNFGGDYVLEHHSMANTRSEPMEPAGRDPVAENEARWRARTLAENWAAPIIITTSVQFLESLFANRSSPCRKLHRLAESVVLFDEVQTLPLPVAVPTLAALSHLSRRYQSSVVFATATQPAFSHLDAAVCKVSPSGWQPGEIAAPSLDLFNKARRTQVDWPVSEDPVPLEGIADQLSREPQALCIVNLKRHASRLHELLTGELRKQTGNDQPYVRHLSTNMCPAHRRKVLDALGPRLHPENPMPCHLISTQCIEAGVDVDFPVAFRAFGPLEAIAQAAGRCNRHGLRHGGKLIVFHPQVGGRLYPSGGYQQAAAVTLALLRERGRENMDIYSQALFEEYYRALYDVARPEAMHRDLTQAIIEQNFAQVASEYRIIDNATVNVLVPYTEALGEWQELADEVLDKGLTADWVRRARPYTVGLYRPSGTDPVSAILAEVHLAGSRGRTRGVAQDWFVCTRLDAYDPDLGLVLPEGSLCWIA